jgi:two-component system LytT family response regulator
MKIRTLIVDDEPLARQRIRLLLENETDIEIAGEAADGNAAIAALLNDAPDLLFLDVQMPGMDGFEVIKAIPPDKLPVVIFTTAYEQHALQAFEAHALDYLLKPFKACRFKDAVSHAREQLASRRAGEATKELLDLIGRKSDAPNHLTRLTVKDGGRMVILKVSEIDAIEAAGKYVVVHSGKENHILRETLTALESQLAPNHFLRISRSAIVNLDHIRELQPMFKGEHIVLLRNGLKLPMTRGLREMEHLLKFS